MFFDIVDNHVLKSYRLSNVSIRSNALANVLIEISSANSSFLVSYMRGKIPGQDETKDFLNREIKND